jgi:RHS repeat-associated protein
MHKLFKWGIIITRFLQFMALCLTLYPFRDCHFSQGTLGTDKKFTGQRLDATGLYYYNARYYDPVIGRLISTDTVVQNPADPQTLNRYLYCINNPLKYVDPT